MITVTAARMRELDRMAIEDAGISGEDLMDRAGRAVAEAVVEICEAASIAVSGVELIAGKGNNGGDAFVAACYLRNFGYSPVVRLTCRRRDLKGDSLNHFVRMFNSGVPVVEWPLVSDWKKAEMDCVERCAVVVDGILGTGITGAARGAAGEAIRYVNSRVRGSAVVSIDVPSGMNADSGTAEGPAVLADVTVTMGLPKKGLIQPCAVNYTGNLKVADIGIPAEATESLVSDQTLISACDVCCILGMRQRDAHKGTFGRALMIGGARGYTGAITMSAKALVRSGAGLLSVVAPEGLVPVIAGRAPEAMVHRCVENSDGGLSSEGIDEWMDRLNEFDVVLAGSGMTSSTDTLEWIQKIISKRIGPLVLDADGINVLKGKADLVAGSKADIVITPHPGELARILNCSVSDVERDRFGSAEKTAREFGVTVILKGAGSLVACVGQPMAVNMTGNPGMATGGSGDVLAGVLGGLLAQGIGTYDAARLAVYVHGRAGDFAARDLSQVAMTAGDIIHYLPEAFREVAPR